MSVVCGVTGRLEGAECQRFIGSRWGARCDPPDSFRPLPSVRGKLRNCLHMDTIHTRGTFDSPLVILPFCRAVLYYSLLWAGKWTGASADASKESHQESFQWIPIRKCRPPPLLLSLSGEKMARQ